ncbi:MAG: DUF4167 domain-containing protein [Novosphingobium sp.]|uniref:DUF4167 domain-containing protein n=1 Tax=Novosphingobium sp. TaxID=1874826 RepID=UPI0032B9CA86
MNNNNRGNSGNNNNNNRRRGRSNRPQGNGGGQQLNRVDSRARGNAPQLLEKYRKLAHDAHLNGDRVQSEYYLQFADHYFRVLADARVRQDEQRSRPQGERWAEAGDDGDDAGDFSSASDFPSFDQPTFSRPPRDERPQREERPRREERSERGNQNQESAEAERGSQQQPEEPDGSEGSEANAYEPAENPFVRGDRARPGLRPRRETGDRPPRARRDTRDEAASTGLDPALLPPAISVSREEPADEAEPKPRKPRARRKPSADDETLETVN